MACNSIVTHLKQNRNVCLISFWRGHKMNRNQSKRAVEYLRFKSIFLTLTFIILTFSMPALAATITTPLVLYTDILSGPNSGGENNKGAYLSIFGKNFGATGLGTTTKVYINNVEVDNYRYLGTSHGRTDIQQI